MASETVGEACMAVIMEVEEAIGTATLARTMQLNPPLSRLIAAVRAEERAAAAERETVLRVALEECGAHEGGCASLRRPGVAGPCDCPMAVLDTVP